MFSHFYQKNIIEKPKVIFSILLLCLVSFGYFSKDFKLDASSETLLIDGDPDLKYLREITERYNSKEFLVLTYFLPLFTLSSISFYKVTKLFLVVYLISYITTPPNSFAIISASFLEQVTTIFLGVDILLVDTTYLTSAPLPPVF